MTRHAHAVTRRTRPFETVSDPAFFYPSRQHKEALDRLLYVVRDGNMGFALLTGEVGCGKTLVAKMLEARLTGPDYETILVRNTPELFQEMLCELHLQLQSSRMRRPLEDRASLLKMEPYDLLCRLRDLIHRKIVIPRHHLVLILDEAQQLSADALVRLKGLTNLCEHDKNYLTVLLVGQPECLEQMRALPQVDQRVGLRYHLAPLAPEEVGPYVQRRLAQASHPLAGQIEPEALQVLFEETGGFPREINRICKLAISRAEILGYSRIDAVAIRMIAQDILRQNELAYG